MSQEYNAVKDESELISILANQASKRKAAEQQAQQKHQQQQQQASSRQPLRNQRYSLEGQENGDSNNQEQPKSTLSSNKDAAKARRSAGSSRLYQHAIKSSSKASNEIELSPVSAASPLPETPASQKSKHKSENTGEEEKKEEDLDGDDEEEEEKDVTETVVKQPKPAVETENQEEDDKADDDNEDEMPNVNTQPDEQPDNLPPPRPSVDEDEVEAEQGGGYPNDDDDMMMPPDDDDDDDMMEVDMEEDEKDNGDNDDLIPPSPPASPTHNNDDLGATGGSLTPEDDNDDGKSIEPNTTATPHSQQKEKESSDSDGEDDAAKKRAKQQTVEEDDSDSEEEPPPKKAAKKKPAKAEPKKKKKLKSAIKKTKSKKKRRVIEDSDEDDDDSGKRSVVIQAPPPKKKKKATSRFTTVFSPKGIPQPREYEAVPVSAYKESPEQGVRRSSRARTKPLAFWKNERIEYGPQDDDEVISEDLSNMPVPKNIIRAKETPYKKRDPPKVTRAPTNKKSKGGKGGKGDAAVAEVEMPRFDSSKLRKKYEYIDNEEALLWDDGVEECRTLKVVSHNSKMEARKLPLAQNRQKSEGKVVGKAAQAFNVPNGPKVAYCGFIVGNLILPPKGIKDAESVGSCSQVFTVVRCQPGACEVAFSDPENDNEEDTFNPATAQRFLLSPGDMFRVPPGNSYRLANHSKLVEAFLTWTIIRPSPVAQFQQQQEEDDDQGSPASSGE